jgi:hypothetical protein
MAVVCALPAVVVVGVVPVVVVGDAMHAKDLRCPHCGAFSGLGVMWR